MKERMLESWDMFKSFWYWYIVLLGAYSALLLSIAYLVLTLIQLVQVLITQL